MAAATIGFASGGDPISGYTKVDDSGDGAEEGAIATIAGLLAGSWTKDMAPAGGSAPAVTTEAVPGGSLLSLATSLSTD